MTNTDGAPGAHATKDELVDYAVQQGHDRATVEALTKDEIRDRLDQGPTTTPDQQAAATQQQYLQDTQGSAAAASPITGNNPPTPTPPQ